MRNDVAASCNRRRLVRYVVCVCAGPNPVSNVEQLVDTRNMTLEWPVPGGRVEWYSLHWRPVGPGAAAGDRNLSAPAGPRARAALDGLQPGRAYTVSIAAHSHNLSSDVFTMDTRTRRYPAL